MPATSRLEKHKGFTLFVREGWISVVCDATGHEVSGPVDNDDDVRRVTSIAIPALRALAGEITV